MDMDDPRVVGETYLGDGVYASFDGWQIQLRAPREKGDHVVYLEPGLYRELQRFATACWAPLPEDPPAKQPF
jgi:hypothetical protein